MVVFLRLASVMGLLYRFSLILRKVCLISSNPLEKQKKLPLAIYVLIGLAVMAFGSFSRTLHGPTVDQQEWPHSALGGGQ